METTKDDEGESKHNLEIEKQICRCCLTTEKRMISAVDVQEYFMELAGINVTVSDGVPQWVCFECTALMQKAVSFKYKVVRAHSMLYEYLMRCAPFPVEPTDPELARYRSPHLTATQTLTFDSSKSKIGFHKDLQQEKQLVKSELYEIRYEQTPLLLEPQPPVEPPPAVEPDAVKEELHISDFEDDIPLEEFRTTGEDGAEDVQSEPEGKRKKKTKEPKSRKKKKTSEDKEVEVQPQKKNSIRKPIEIDPQKIRIITLNPEEQIRQREEESKALVKFPFQCGMCFKGFNFESKLQNHMTKHSPSRGQFECKLCSMYLPTMYSYSVHSLIHTRRYECVQCGRRMIDRASIYHHYRTQHEGITTVITCDICGKVSSNSKTHRGHIRNHHSGDRPKCDQCGKSFINKDSLTEHMHLLTKACLKCTSVINEDEINVADMDPEVILIIEQYLGHQLHINGIMCPQCFGVIMQQMDSDSPLAHEDNELQHHDDTNAYELQHHDDTNAYELQHHDDTNAYELQHHDDTNACVRCRKSLFRRRSHSIGEGAERQFIAEAIAPREIPEAGVVCFACWVYTRRIIQQHGITPASQRTDEVHACVRCQRSLARTRSHSLPEGPERDVISAMIHPREIPPGRMVCYACWVAARRHVERVSRLEDKEQTPGPSGLHQDSMYME